MKKDYLKEPVSWFRLDEWVRRLFNKNIELETRVEVLENSGDGYEPPYKVYTAILNQGGITAPVATVLENTLGEIPTFSYNGIGEYTINSALNQFNSETTVIEFHQPNDIPNSLSYGIPEDNIIPLFAQTDGSIIYAKLEIKVY